MRAVVKNKAATGLQMQDVPEPVTAAGEVRIKPLVTSVCGTDLHIYKWDTWAQRVIKPPRIIGHEFVGEVEQIGPGVTGIELGQRVVGEGHMTCGTCRNCREGRRHLCEKAEGLGIDRDGCFADLFCLPARNIFRIPEEIPNDLAAIFDPFGNAVHTALTFDLIGEDVLITGSGPIGLMAVLLAKHAGARSITVTDISDARLAMAEAFGATAVVNVRKSQLSEVLAQQGIEGGFGVGLEMSGNATALGSMLRTMRHGGQVALLGILPDEAPVEWSQIIFKGLAIKGIYGRKIFRTWYKMVSLIQGGLDISPVITHRFPAADWQQAFDAMDAGGCGKVLIDWT